MAKYTLPCQILEMPEVCAYFASLGKNAAVLPSTNHIWLKAK